MSNIIEYNELLAFHPGYYIADESKAITAEINKL